MLRLYNLIESIERSVLIGEVIGNYLPSERFAMSCFQLFKAPSIRVCALVLTLLAILRRH